MSKMRERPSELCLAAGEQPDEEARLAADGEGGTAEQRDELLPQRAEGVELMGRYEDSGFKEPPYMVRRLDGQIIQLPSLLYTIVEAADGSRDYDALVHEVRSRLNLLLVPEDVAFLVEKRLRPLGVLANADSTSPKLERVDPMLALKLRVAVVPTVFVRALAYVLKPLFLPLFVTSFLIALVAVDVWLFAVHGIAQSVRSALYEPLTLLLVLALLATSAAFHECGHAAACRYGGARPGAMGVGLYLVWPAFYTDVTDAYRLGRHGRLRTDLGGIYFNAIFIVATAMAYLATGIEPLLLFIAVQHIEMFHQLLPFLRLDGYYIVSDLVGVPDMFSRIGPTLASLVPGRPADERVRALKPWARAVVTAYVFTVVPILVLIFGLMTLNAPRVFATAWDSVSVHYEQASSAIQGGETLMGVASGVQMGVLALPAAGMAASFGRIGKRALNVAWKQAAGRPIGRAELVLATAAVTGWAAFIWWPNGDYGPIQTAERGTVQGAIAQIPAIPGGRPALTGDRSRELAGIESETTPAETPEEGGPTPRPSPTTAETDTGGAATSSTSPTTASVPSSTSTTTPTTTTTAPTTTSTTTTAATTTTPTTSTTDSSGSTTTNP
jgi:putative peptide zinc metalloprotease protein